jgi:LytS/YehU family sensor histidine kinase
MLARLYEQIFTRNNRWQGWFWLIVMLEAPFFAVLFGNAPVGEAVLFRAVGLVSKMIAAYTLSYYLIPHLLFKKKYISFFMALLLFIPDMSILARFINIYIAEAIVFPGMPNENLWQIISAPAETLDMYFNRVFPYAFWFTFLKVGVDQLRTQQKVIELSEEKATAELNLLKAQIHPHFLFNTLNNLYTLTLEKSDDAPEVVEKLSGILDYLLYRCNEPRVPLQLEIELIEHYLKLESLRYGNRLNLSFTHQVDRPEAIMMAPLILISPVENAFKHGASGNSEAPAITIDLTVEHDVLSFIVWNNKLPTPNVDTTNYTAGIGLKNIQKQLNLVYPDKHQLTIKEEETEYQVMIKVWL